MVKVTLFYSCVVGIRTGVAVIVVIMMEKLAFGNWFLCLLLLIWFFFHNELKFWDFLVMSPLFATLPSSYRACWKDFKQAYIMKERGSRG